MAMPVPVFDPKAVIEGRPQGRTPVGLIVAVVAASVCALLVLLINVGNSEAGGHSVVPFLEAFPLALLPVPLLMFLVLLLDRLEPEPRWNLALAFLWGAGVAALTPGSPSRTRSPRRSRPQDSSSGNRPRPWRPRAARLRGRCHSPALRGRPAPALGTIPRRRLRHLLRPRTTYSCPCGAASGTGGLTCAPGTRCGMTHREKGQVTAAPPEPAASGGSRLPTG